MQSNKKLIFSDTVFAQQVDGEIVLLDMNTENYFGLDSVASDIWKLFQDGKTVGETRDALLEMYDVDPERLDNDMETFIKTLLDNKLATLV